MSGLQQLALRCLLPGFQGTAPPDWVRSRAAAGLGGVVLFGRNVESKEQVRRLTDALHAERGEFVVAVDEEGGDVTRLEAKTGSSYPGNLALGVAGDPGLTADVAAAIGAELGQAGVDLNLAPVADVNSNPFNPVIGVRSFGSDPAAVARHTAAYVEGMQSAGVAACAKHFPGHGDTSADSHLALPVAARDPRLGALEPFQAAIHAGVRAIMSAHIVAPALDDLPATISRRMMHGVLREQLGFDGLVITDGLDMVGLSGKCGVAEAAVLALRAGCDALCVGGGPSDEAVVEAIVAAIVEAVEQGRLFEERLHEAASRMDRVKVEDAHPTAKAGAALEVARRAVCVDGDVRVGAEANVIRLESPGSIAAGEVPWGIEQSLAARGVRLADTGRVVIEVRDLHRRHRAAVDALLDRHPDAVLVEMGVPAHRPPKARNYVATHGSARVLADSAAEVIAPR